MSDSWSPHFWYALLTLLRISKVEENKKQEIQSLLDASRKELSCPLEFPKRNPQHHEEVKAGKGFVGGAKFAIEMQHIDQILLLAEELEIDEHLATSLFREVHSTCANKENLLSNCLLHYYRERGNKLACLEYLLDNAQPGSAHPLQTFFHEYLTSLSKSNGGINESILSQLKQFKVVEIVSKPISEGLRLLTDHASTIQFRVAEIQSLGRIYFKLCECSLLTTSDVSDLIDVLSQSQDIDTIFIHLLVTLLRYMNSLSSKLPLRLAEENTFDGLSNKLSRQTWKVEPAQALASLFFNLGAYSYYTLAPMEEESGKKANRLAASMTELLKNGALHFAIMYLFTNQERTQIITQPIKGQENLMDLCKSTLWKAHSGKPSQALLLESYLCEPEFKQPILSCLGFFLSNLPAKIAHSLRIVHSLEEDQLLAYHGQQEMQDPRVLSQLPYVRRHFEPNMNFLPHEGIYKLIGLVYSQLPDPQLSFLDEKSSLLSFLRLSVKSKSSRLMMAALDMLSGLASLSGLGDWVFRLFIDESSSQHLFSWNWLYNHLVNLAKNVRTSQGSVFIISANDKVMLKCFLRLFTAVFSNSKLAHATPGQGHGINTLRPLFALITCPLDTDLKALFLQAIGAMAHPLQSPELFFQLWAAIDNLKLLGPEQSMAVEMTKFEMELESNQLTLAFLGLIDRLICIKPLQSGPVACATLPAELGAEYRTPGIQPYLAFIIDELFIKSFSRTYQSFYQHWEVVDLCLRIVNKCLADLRVLINVGQHQQLKLHPGFYLISRVLQTGAFSNALLHLVDSGVQDLESFPQGLYPLREQATLHTLQILSNVSALQDAFISKVGLPLQTAFEYLPNAASVTPLQKLLFHRNNDATLIQLASYVMYKDKEIASLSVQLLSFLCSDKATSEPGAKPLLQVLWSHPKSYLITEWFSNELMHSHYISSLDAQALNPTVAILDAILKDIDSSSVYSLSHLLLGYTTDSSNWQQLHPTHEFTTCFHAILDVLTHTLKPSAAEGTVKLGYSSDIIAKCFEIISKLCTNKATSTATLLYLRSQHDFVFTHLHWLPTWPTMETNAGLATVTDQMHRALPHDIINHIKICTSIFEITSRELLETKGQGEHGHRLIQVLLALNLQQMSRPLWVTDFLLTATTPWFRHDPDFSPTAHHLYAQIREGCHFYVTREGTKCWNAEALDVLLNSTSVQASDADKEALLTWIRLEADIPQVVAVQRSMVHAWGELLKLAVNFAPILVDPIALELVILELMLGLLLFVQTHTKGLSQGLDTVGDILFHLANKLNSDFRHTHSPSTLSLEVPTDRAHMLTDKMSAVWDGLIYVFDISGGFEGLRLSLYKTVAPFLDYVRSFGVDARVPADIHLSQRGQELLIGNACYDMGGPSKNLKLASLRLLEYLCPLLPLHPKDESEQSSLLPKALPKLYNMKNLVQELKQDVIGLWHIKDQAFAYGMYTARVSLFVALAQTPLGVGLLLENGIFWVLIESGLFNAHLDESVLAHSDIPVQEGSYQVIEPLLLLLNSMLSNGNGSKEVAAKQASLALYTHSDLISSILNFRGRRLTFRCLRLMDLLVSFITKITLNCKACSWKDYGFSSMYLTPMLNIVAYLSDRSLWSAKLTPYFTEEVEAHLTHKDIVCPDVSSFQSEVDRVVDTILLNAAIYCRLVYCDGTPLVPIQSPLGFQAISQSQPSINALINFTPKTSIKNLLDILQQTHAKLIKSCRNNLARKKLFQNPETIDNDKLKELVPFSSSETPAEVRFHHMRARAKLVLGEQIHKANLLMKNQITLLKEALMLLYRQLDVILDIESPNSSSPFRRPTFLFSDNKPTQLQVFRSSLDGPLKKVLQDLTGLNTKSTYNQLETEYASMGYLQCLAKLTMEVASSSAL